MKYLKLDLFRLFVSLITSPLIALAFYIMDTKVEKHSFIYWQTKSIILVLIAFTAYLTVAWLNRLFIYFNKKK